VLSHDLGNALNIAVGRLELARETGDSTNLEAVEDSLQRATDILADLTDAIKAGSVVDEVTDLDVGDVFDLAWATQETNDAKSDVESGMRIRADEMALLRVFENLIRNTVEHGGEGGPSASVRSRTGSSSRTTDREFARRTEPRCSNPATPRKRAGPESAFRASNRSPSRTAGRRESPTVTTAVRASSSRTSNRPRPRDDGPAPSHRQGCGRNRRPGGRDFPHYSRRPARFLGHRGSFCFWALFGTDPIARPIVS